MGYYDNLYKSVYDSVYRRNFARDSAWRMAKRAANIAVYDAQQRDVRAAESGSGRLSTIYKALMRGQTVVAHKPIEKRVEMTPGEALSAIYKAAGISTTGGYLPGGTPGYSPDYKGGRAGGKFVQRSFFTPDGQEVITDRAPMAKDLNKKQRNKLLTIMQTINAGGTVTVEGQVLDKKSVDLLMKNYGGIPSTAKGKLPSNVTPVLEIRDGQMELSTRVQGLTDAQRFQDQIARDARQSGGIMAEHRGVKKGMKYDLLTTWADDDTYTINVIPHTRWLEKGAERFKAPGYLSPKAIDAYKEKGWKVSDPTGLDREQRAEATMKGQNIETVIRGEELSRLAKPEEIATAMGVDIETAKSVTAGQRAKMQAERKAFMTTLQWDGPGKGKEGPAGKEFKIPQALSQEAVDYYRKLQLDPTTGEKGGTTAGPKITRTGGSKIFFGSGTKAIAVPLSAAAQKHYAKLGVKTSNVTASGQTVAGHGVRRSSKNPYGGKSAIGTAWGAHKASVLGQAKGIVEDEQKWYAEQEKRQKEWDEYYKWVAEQEKLYEEQKKAEEKAEKQYQKDLAAYKKKKGQEEMADWAAPTAYRKDRIQKPRRRPRQQIMQDAQSAVNWGMLSNPFEAGTLGGMGRPLIRQEVRRRAREMGVTPREFRMNFFSPQIRQDIRQTVKAKAGKALGVKPMAKTTPFFSPAFILSGYGKMRGYGTGGKKQ